VEKKLGEEVHEQCAMLSVPLNWSSPNNGFLMVELIKSQNNDN
jgi:hypothetical protein